MIWLSVALAGSLWQPEVPTGPLTGLTVYLSAGHGKLLHRENHDGIPVAWGYQRSRFNGVLEDRWTANFVIDHLAPALEEAGANVIALRERDRNRQRVIVDDLDDGFSWAQGIAWHEDRLAVEGHDLTLEPTGSATWSVTVPDDGHFTVYSQWVSRPNQDHEAVYVVEGGGFSFVTRADQRHHGGHWNKIADGCWRKGTKLTVTLLGSGAGELSADAVRIGGGEHISVMPEVKPYFAITPNWDAAFIHTVSDLGAPPEILTYACGAPKSDMRMRAHWVSWAHPPAEEAVFLSIHTNGGGGRGLLVFAGKDSTPATPPFKMSTLYAKSIEKTIRKEVGSKWKGYRSLGALPGDYSEISPVHNKAPAALIEVAFHDNPRDAKLLKQEAFRVDVATAIVKGLIEVRKSGER